MFGGQELLFEHEHDSPGNLGLIEISIFMTDKKVMLNNPLCTKAALNHNGLFVLLKKKI